MSERDAKWNAIRARRILSEREVYELAGCMLFRLHEFEKVLRFSFHLLHATFTPAEVDLDTDHFIWKMRKATCGKFCSDLRKVVKIDASFDRLLVRLVRRRNFFVHKLSLRKEFNPGRCPNWHENVARFIFRLEADVVAAWDIFAPCAETLIQQANLNLNPRDAMMKSNIAALKKFRPIEIH